MSTNALKVSLVRMKGERESVFGSREEDTALNRIMVSGNDHDVHVGYLLAERPEQAREDPPIQRILAEDAMPKADWEEIKRQCDSLTGWDSRLGGTPPEVEIVDDSEDDVYEEDAEPDDEE